MTFSPASRLYGLETSIFATMSRLAVEHGAVNLGQGFPDFDGPAWIFDEAREAMLSGRNQYAPMPGVLSLRRAIAGVWERHYRTEVDPDTEITICAGATEALFSTMLAFLNPGDEVILFEPFYDSYDANIRVAGAVPVCVTLHTPDFRFDPDELRAAITPRTKMLVLNNPHNPTGAVLSHEDHRIIAALACEHDLLVVSDEVYEFLTFDEAVHRPIATLPGMRERTITISSTGKTFGMTGWKIGWALAPAPLTAAIRSLHQFVTFAVNTPGQHAMAQALGRLEGYLPEFRALYAAKRDLLFEALRDSPFRPHRPQGSYFMMVDIPPALGMGDVDCAMHLVTKAGVAVIPPSVFYRRSDEGTRLLRLCFAKKDETLHAGIAALLAVHP